MSYFGSDSDRQCKFIGRRCAINGVTKGTIVDSTSTLVKHHRVFAVKLDGRKYFIRLFYSDIKIDGWDKYKQEFNNDRKFKV